MQFLSVYGLVDTATFQQCSDAAAHVNAKYPDLYNVTVNLEMPVDFRTRRQRLINDGVTMKSDAPAVMTIQSNNSMAPEEEGGCHATIASMDVLVVDEKHNTVQSGEDFVRHVERETTFRTTALPAHHADSYASRAHRSFAAFLSDRGNRYCWMDVCCGGRPLGRVTFELFSKLTPHTSQNFWRLCRGDMGEVVDKESGERVRLSYKGTSFFRVLRDAWVMGGDVSPGHGGNGGYSCYGRFFPDECFAVPHDGPGVLGMCNDGAHSNASAFYITRKKLSWMNEKYVAFGRVVDGMDVVDAIHAAPTKHNQGPVEPIVISDCGVIETAP